MGVLCVAGGILSAALAAGASARSAWADLLGVAFRRVSRPVVFGFLGPLLLLLLVDVDSLIASRALAVSSASRNASAPSMLTLRLLVDFIGLRP